MPNIVIEEKEPSTLKDIVTDLAEYVKFIGGLTDEDRMTFNEIMLRVDEET